MARKPKLTGFARFLIIMVFLAPLAFVGASYYNGQDGLENLKDVIGIGEKTSTELTIGEKTNTDKDTKDLIQLVEDMNKVIDDLRAENKDLKAQLYEKDQEIKRLTEQ